LIIARRLKWILVALAAFLALLLGCYWLADTWLESSGGRSMLEQELSERFGMNVRLDGEFNLMLFPDIGVSGTELIVGGDGTPDTTFAYSSEFEISVFLQPLLHGQVVVEWIRLSDGRVHPARYTRAGSQPAAAAMQLPEIREFTLRDFQIVLAENGGAVLSVKSLEVRDFAESRQAVFSLEIENLVAADGWLLWDTTRSVVQLGELQFDLSGQVLTGEACVLLLDPPRVNVQLTGQSFDFDAFRESLPLMDSAATGEDDSDLPMDIRARFNVDELRTGGVTARGVELQLGREMNDVAVCGSG